MHNVLVVAVARPVLSWLQILPTSRLAHFLTGGERIVPIVTDMDPHPEQIPLPTELPPRASLGRMPFGW